MSEAKDSGESERELSEPSDDEQVEAEVEGGFPSLTENPGEQNSSDFIGTPLESGLAEHTIGQTNGPSEFKNGDGDPDSVNLMDVAADHDVYSDAKAEKDSGLGNMQVENGVELIKAEELLSKENASIEASLNQERMGVEYPVHMEGSNQSFNFDPHLVEGNDSGTEEEQAAFMKELENFFRERSMEFKPPKFYGEGLNCLKLWRAVTRLGGYDQVTSCKLWRQVGESFKPPKTCTTVSWSFRCFYEKALLEYEKHKIHTGELQVPVSSLAEPMVVENQIVNNPASGSGRARRDAAARAMQGWHSQRLLGNGEVGDPIIKDKSSASLPKRDKQLKSIGVFKRKKALSLDRAVKVARTKVAKTQFFAARRDNTVVDVGAPADWVKINVRRTKECFEVYALVPGLLREEVHVQSDPAGRVVISGEPEQPDNPWGVTPFKKIITLPSRIDPHQTSAVVTLHGQLFVRAPFEQPDL